MRLSPRVRANVFRTVTAGTAIPRRSEYEVEETEFPAVAVTGWY